MTSRILVVVYFSFHGVSCNVSNVCLVVYHELPVCLLAFATIYFCHVPGRHTFCANPNLYPPSKKVSCEKDFDGKTRSNLPPPKSRTRTLYSQLKYSSLAGCRMLLRAARQRLQCNAASKVSLDAELLQLPFLCPALYKPVIHPRTTSSQARPPLDKKSSTTRSVFRQKQEGNRVPCRGLASAAAAEYEPFQEDFIPWAVPPHLQYDKTPQFGPETIPTPQGFDLNPSPLILDDMPVTAPDKFRSADAISGDLNEIHQTLHTCLQVGRLGRAAALLRRLNQIYKPDAPGLLSAHKDYLREVTLRIIRTKDMKLLMDLKRWFEVEMGHEGIPQDASTFALIIQASLQDPNEKRRIRTIRRYYRLAQDAGLEGETRKLIPELESVLQVGLNSEIRLALLLTRLSRECIGIPSTDLHSP